MNEHALSASGGSGQASRSDEVDMQVATAHQYPRSVKACVEEIGALATMDEETAASCMYVVPRAGGYIEGYSIRFAEICMAAWGNIRVASRILPRDGQNVIAEAMCWDLEKNVARVKTCKRKAGTFAGAEELAEAAAQSIASRDAVLSVIPQGIVRKVRDQIRAMLLGTDADGNLIASDFADLRKKILGGFKRHGVEEMHLVKWVGPDAKGAPKPPKSWTADDLFALRTLLANIRNGERSTKSEFGVEDKRSKKATDAPIDEKKSGSDAPKSGKDDALAELAKLSNHPQYTQACDAIGVMPLDPGSAEEVQIREVIELLRTAKP